VSLLYTHSLPPWQVSRRQQLEDEAHEARVRAVKRVLEAEEDAREAERKRQEAAELEAKAAAALREIATLHVSPEKWDKSVPAQAAAAADMAQTLREDARGRALNSTLPAARALLSPELSVAGSEESGGGGVRGGPALVGLLGGSDFTTSKTLQARRRLMEEMRAARKAKEKNLDAVSLEVPDAPPTSLLLPLPMSLLYTHSVDNSSRCRRFCKHCPVFLRR
jgi:hypothetical protein